MPPDPTKTDNLPTSPTKNTIQITKNWYNKIFDLYGKYLTYFYCGIILISLIGLIINKMIASSAPRDPSLLSVPRIPAFILGLSGSIDGLNSFLLLAAFLICACYIVFGTVKYLYPHVQFNSKFNFQDLMTNVNHDLYKPQKEDAKKTMKRGFIGFATTFVLSFLITLLGL